MSPSDREILEAMLQRAGIGWTAKDDAIELEARKGKVGGYFGFVALFEFDGDGALKAVEVWE